MNEIDRKYHKVADIFPMMSSDEYEALKEDIATHGLLEPIWIHADGSIIDGRNRHRACVELEITPQFRPYTGDNPVAFSLSQNVKRRHLSDTQLATIAVQALPMLQAEAKAKMMAAGAEHGILGAEHGILGGRGNKKNPPEADLPQGGLKASPRAPQARDIAAAMVGVSPRLVQDAKKISEEAPDLFLKMQADEITVTAAMCELKRRKQQEEHPPSDDSADEYCDHAPADAYMDLRQPEPDDNAEATHNPDVDDEYQAKTHHAALSEIKKINQQEEHFRDDGSAESAPMVDTIAVQERQNLRLAAANHVISDDPNYDGDEWYTPSDIIQSARALMGGIDIDPASCDAAQELIQAGAYLTKDDNALQDGIAWSGRMWLNPPYSMPLIRQFIDKAIQQYECGNVTEAVIITNNSSDTAWFHELLSRYPACFTKGRVKFWRPNHDDFGARQGQTLFYMGNNVAGFVSEFNQHGQVVIKV